MKTFLSAAIMLAMLGILLIPVNGIIVNASHQTGTNSGADPVVTVAYCDLIKHPRRFHNQVVRVTGILDKGFEKSSLFDEAGCDKGKTTVGSAQSDTWVSYDESFVMEGDSDEAKMNDSVSGFGRWWVIAVGKFRRAEGSQKLGHLRCCKYDFALMRIEKSEKLPTPKR